MPKDIHVIIIDADEAFRHSLLFFINTMDGFRGAAFADHAAAHRHLDLHVPDVVIMDPLVPRMHAVERVEELVRRLPNVPVLICSQGYDRDTVLAMLRAGVSGYLLKGQAGLIAGIHDVLAGGAPLSPAVARCIVRSFWPEQGSPMEALSGREQQVLRLLAAGMRAKEIGTKLFLSAHTVRTHISSIYGKLQVRNRVEVVNKMRGLRS